MKSIPLIGAHFSISGGLHRAVERAAELNCSVLQIFTKNSRTWKETMPSAPQVEKFNTARTRQKIKFVLSHCSYLINIASNEKQKQMKSESALRAELIRAAMLGIDYVVLHPGAFTASDEDTGLQKAAGLLHRVLKNMPDNVPRLLLETTAGQGTQLGSSFEQLSRLLDRTGQPEKTGICLDTSHIFAAGYDIRTPESYRTTFSLFNSIIGKDRLFAIHVNDSKTGLDSRKDRHEHIGMGCIGPDAFRLLMNDDTLSHIPKILETPKFRGEKQMDPVNLNALLSLVT